MRVLFTMANNSSTPYFTRFAKLAVKDRRISPEFLCLYPKRPGMIDEMAEMGFTCHWLEYDCNKRLNGLVMAYFKSKKLLQKLKPDVVHCHLFDDALPVLWAAKNAGIPRRIISKLDAGFHFLYAPHWVIMDRLNNRHATDIVCVSSSNKKFVLEKEKAQADKIALIPQGINESELVINDPGIIDKMRARFNIYKSPVVLTVARCVDIKGYPELIKAARSVLDHYPDATFLCVGDGVEKDKYIKMTNQLGILSSFVFTGWLDRNELNATYQLADMFCHPALEEPYGFVIIEAMLNKLPLVCTRSGIVIDAVGDRNNGWLVDPGDELALANGIVEMLNSDHTEDCRRAYEFARETYTVEAMWEAHVQLYLKNNPEGK